MLNWIIKHYIVRNIRTTAVGIVSALALTLVNYGLTLSPELQQKLTEWIIAGGMLAIGALAKDGDKTSEDIGLKK